MSKLERHLDLRGGNVEGMSLPKWTILEILPEPHMAQPFPLGLSSWVLVIF